LVIPSPPFVPFSSAKFPEHLFSCCLATAFFSDSRFDFTFLKLPSPSSASFRSWWFAVLFKFWLIPAPFFLTRGVSRGPQGCPSHSLSRLRSSIFLAIGLFYPLRLIKVVSLGQLFHLAKDSRSCDQPRIFPLSREDLISFEARTESAPLFAPPFS